MNAGYLARRLLAVMVVLLIVSLTVFAITLILPGNAAVMILGEYATADQLKALEEQLGLNRPWHVQYLSWIGSILSRRLGHVDAPVGPRRRPHRRGVLAVGGAGGSSARHGDADRHSARRHRGPAARHRDRPADQRVRLSRDRRPRVRDGDAAARLHGGARAGLVSRRAASRRSARAPAVSSTTWCCPR